MGGKVEVEVLVAQSCPTLCDPMDCSPPGSSIHGIFQARKPEWVAISFSRGSSRPRDQTRVSRIASRLYSLSHQGRPMKIVNSSKYDHLGLPRWHSGRISTCQFKGCKRQRFSPWVRKIPGGGNGNPLQYSCLENSMDGGA